MRLLTLILTLGLLAGFALPSGAAEAKKVVTFPAMKLKKVDGGEFDTGSLKGKPAVVNFWATW